MYLLTLYIMWTKLFFVMRKLHLLLHRMESSVTHASSAKKGGLNVKMKLNQKVHVLSKKKLQVQIIAEQLERKRISIDALCT